MNDGIHTAQGTAWNIATGLRHKGVKAIIVERDGMLSVVNVPENVHLRSNGRQVTVRSTMGTVRLDYRAGDRIIAVSTDEGFTVDVRLPNFALFAPLSIQTIHETALHTHNWR